MLPAPHRPYGPARTGAAGYALRRDAAPCAWSEHDRAVLEQRARHLALGEDDELIPWHATDLDARAWATARALREAGDLSAAAELLELVHADPRLRDDRDRAELRELADALGSGPVAERLRRLAGQPLASGRAPRGRAPCATLDDAAVEGALQPDPERPGLCTGRSIWNGARVRLGWQDARESVNPNWVLAQVDAAGDASPRGRHEAAAHAAWRLGQRAPTLLWLPGRRARREAEAALAALAPCPDLALGDGDDALAGWVREGLPTLAGGNPAQVVLSSPPDAGAVQDGTLAALATRLGRIGQDREVRMLVGVDLRPERERVLREIDAADRALAAAHQPLSSAREALQRLTEDDPELAALLQEIR
ncbi:MAG: hypothetical protein RIT45_3346 [Pseudomonadota bacterium]